MKPVISVIFTAGSGVETCRAKLAGQTFKEYEIIEADRFAGLERAQESTTQQTPASGTAVQQLTTRHCLTSQDTHLSHSRHLPMFTQEQRQRER